MAPIFLDTGYIIALEASDDQNHEAASSYWQSLSKPLPPLITTSNIFHEKDSGYFLKRIQLEHIPTQELAADALADIGTWQLR